MDKQRQPQWRRLGPTKFLAEGVAQAWQYSRPWQYQMDFTLQTFNGYRGYASMGQKRYMHNW